MKKQRIGLLTRLAASVALALGVGAASAQSDLPALKTLNTTIVDANGATIHFKGMNLGGWFIQEPYMSPIDVSKSNGGTYYDTYRVLTQLKTRFQSEATADSMLESLIESWVTPADIATIANAGFNVVRIPVWWGQFYSLGAYPTTGDPSSYLRSDAFTYLDQIIAACAQNHVYVILDMHGAFGGQSGNPDTGHENDNTYFTNANNQAATVAMWKMLASHYHSSPYKGTIAAFDLLNEPTGVPDGGSNSQGVPAQTVTDQYDALYHAIRSVDPYRMIIMESCFWVLHSGATSPTWEFDNLPNPNSNGYSTPWTNVVYSTHMYPGSSSTAAQMTTAANQQVSRFNSITSSGYNVPVYEGEFQAYNSGIASWQNVEGIFDNNDIGWTFWTFKAINGTKTNFWGWYDPKSLPTRPNFDTDSQTAIVNNWKQYTTSNLFVQNTNEPATAN